MKVKALLLFLFICKSSNALAGTWLEFSYPIYLGSDQNSATGGAGFSGTLLKIRGSGAGKFVFGIAGGLSSGELTAGGLEYDYSSLAADSVFGFMLNPFEKDFLAPFVGANAVLGFDAIATDTAPPRESKYSGGLRYGYEVFAGSTLVMSGKTNLVLRAAYSVVRRSYAGQTFQWDALKLCAGIAFH